jgi:galactose oxidase-like protein
MPWVVVGNTQVLAVHAALLHTGKVLIFSGDQHDQDLHAAGDTNHTRLYDPATHAVTTLGTPPIDLFCAGHAFLVDGRLLVAGGTDDFPEQHGGIHHDHFPGTRESWAFNPRTNAWTTLALMNPEPGRTTGGGRWYPTLVTLADGKVLALTGHPKADDSRHDNNSPESFSPSPRNAGTWRLIGPGPDPAHAMAYYPRVHVLPDGDVFIVTPVAGQSVRLRTDGYAWRDVAPVPTDPIYHGFGCSTVLLPLRHDQGYRPRVLAVNGSQPMIIDLGAGAPAWAPTAPRTLAGSPRREHGFTVLLPTGEVLSCGGAQNPADDATGVRTAEIFNPDTNTWRTTDTAAVVRNYHSVATLLPDGRVWTAGGNRNATQSFPSPGVDNRELRIELWEPPYYTASRPSIQSAPASAGWGQAIDVRTTQADQIRRVALIRAGSVTHAQNYDQRYVTCDFRRQGTTDWLDVKMPPNPSIAPPGYYMLFTINASGIPSPGRFIRISPAATNSGFMVQSSFGRKGNFEAVGPRAGGALGFAWRNNDGGTGWSAVSNIPGATGIESVPSLIQGNYGTGNLELVARAGDRLAFFWRDGGWHGPDLFASGVSGNPAMIQGIFGGRGNFELVVPAAGGGLHHWWRNNDFGGWNGPTAFGGGAGAVAAVTLIQSTFGDPGNLEVVARIGNRLALFWRTSEPPWTWSGPFFFHDGVRGVPGFIQAHFGNHGNFEVVTPAEGGGLRHLWRDNDAPGLPWHVGPTFGGTDPYRAVSLLESNFGNPGPGGNLELIAQTESGQWRGFWRGDNSATWNAMPAPAF